MPDRRTQLPHCSPCCEIAPERHSTTKRKPKRQESSRKSLADLLAAKQKTLIPFHWHLEFPDVFFQPDGTARAPMPSAASTAVLGNPPYISTHTSSAEQAGATLLEQRAGYLEDLYVHFTDLGFELLRPGGAFGFIVSDTFFTLATSCGCASCCKATPHAPRPVRPVRRHGGRRHLRRAQRHAAPTITSLLFVQARPRKDADGKPTKPEQELP